MVSLSALRIIGSFCELFHFLTAQLAVQSNFHAIAVLNHLSKIITITLEMLLDDQYIIEKIEKPVVEVWNIQ